jgi:5'-3' exonuclease
MGVTGGFTKKIMAVPKRKSLIACSKTASGKATTYIVFDAASLVYRYVIGSFNSKEYIVDASGKKIPEIYYLFSFAVRFLSLGIIPVFVFDGAAPPEKADTLERRRNVKEKAEKMIKKEDNHGEDGLDGDQSDDIGPKMDIDQFIRYLKQSYRPDSKNIETAKLLLRWMGVPVIDAPGEADSLCAQLSRRSDVIGVITEDSDLLMHRAQNILKMQNLGSNTILEYSLDATLTNMTDAVKRIIERTSDKNIKDIYAGMKVQFTHENLVEFGCLLGNDYTPGLKIKTGEKRRFDSILELYVKYGLSLENLAAGMNIGYGLLSSLQNAKKMYMAESSVDPETIDITMKGPSVDMVKKLGSSFIDDTDLNGVIGMLKYIHKSNTKMIDRSQDDRFSSCWNSYRRRYAYHNIVRAYATGVQSSGSSGNWREERYDDRKYGNTLTRSESVSKSATPRCYTNVSSSISWRGARDPTDPRETSYNTSSLSRSWPDPKYRTVIKVP